MSSEGAPSAGIYLLPLSDTQSVAWDERQHCLTFTFGPPPADPAAASKSAVLRLNNFPEFEKDMRALLKRYDPSRLELIQFRSESGLEGVPSPALRAAVGRFASLLLRFSLKSHNARAREVAEGVLRELGADSAETAWRVQYDDALTHEYRYKFLEQAYLSLHQRYRGEGVNGSPETDSSEVDLREAYWWTAGCLYRMALDWDKHEGVSNPNAHKARRQAMTAYLGTLKDEPRTRDLERFLIECGTSLEAEVKNILLSPKNNRDLRDEVVGRIFVPWFLRRYDLVSAWRLGQRASAGRAELILLLVAFALVAISVYHFSLETPHDYLCLKYTHSPCAPAFVLQLGLQLGALLVAVVGASTYFRLIMPRALFGTFLSWLTIILLSVMPGLGQASVYTGSEKVTLALVVYRLLVNDNAWTAKDPLLLFIIAPLLLSCVFVVNEVNNFVRDRKTATLRTLLALGVIYIGALFWGLTFALPVKYMLEGALAPEDITYRVYLWRIALPGSSLAVLFGILVQLLWEDKSITEPIGEPL